MAHVRADFDDFDAFKHALGSLQDAGFDNYEAYGPVNLEDISSLMPKRGSYVRGIATGGALVGLGLFFYMCVATSLIYNLIVGGKPPVSNVPYIIIAYEGTILLGAIAAFLGVIVLARLLTAEPTGRYNMRFSGDTFGIDVECEQRKVSEVKGIMKNAGANDIDDGDAQ